MSVNSSAAKRRRSNDDDGSHSDAPASVLELPPIKRPRQHETPAYLTRLSDELFLRIASHLTTNDLASFQRVSRRCQRIAVDSQVWRALYNKRFVRARPSGQSRPLGTQATMRDWKSLYKLRHNWNSGSCVVRELDITASEANAEGSPDASSSAQLPTLATLVKLYEGIVFTADAVHGLRAWRLQGEEDQAEEMGVHDDGFIVGQKLPDGGVEEGFGAPTAMAIDDESDVRVGRKANLALGFSGGGFVMYQLDMTDPMSPIFRVRYRRRYRASDHNGSEDRAITSLECLGPFLSVMRSHSWTFYGFSFGLHGVGGPSGEGNMPEGAASLGSTKRPRMISQAAIQEPVVLATLRSASVWPPVALSLRRSINQTIIAAIVYAYPLYVSGWSVGIQELRFATNESGETSITRSRIATAVAAGFTPITTATRATSGTWLPGLGPWSRSQLNDPPLSRPTSLSYSHPYLVSSHTDNTLTLYMVRSTDTGLTIEQGQRLWGHTSAVGSVQVGGRGKAVSISARSMELRAWELEGGVSDRRRINASVKIEPASPSQTAPNIGQAHATISDPIIEGSLGGFDDEKVVVLRKQPSMRPFHASSDNTTSETVNEKDIASAEEPIQSTPKLALVVYDFTR